MNSNNKVTTRHLRSDQKCFCGNAAIQWCGKCRAIFYCSKECRDNDRKQHRKACSENLEETQENLKKEYNIVVEFAKPMKS